MLVIDTAIQVLKPDLTLPLEECLASFLPEGKWTSKKFMKLLQSPPFCQQVIHSLMIKKPKRYSIMWWLNWGLGLSGMDLCIVLVAAGVYVVIDTAIQVLKPDLILPWIETLPLEERLASFLPEVKTTGKWGTSKEFMKLLQSPPFLQQVDSFTFVFKQGRCSEGTWADYYLFLVA